MRGTTSHPPSFHVAGVAQTHIHRCFAWQAWHSWHWVARLDWLGRPWRPWRRGTLRGRRGTTSHPPSFCVAGVAQTHIYRRFAWQAWHRWHWVARLDWLGRPWRPWRRGTLRGRRGTTSHPPSFCVAGVAQSQIHLRFAWQAWHSCTGWRAWTGLVARDARDAAAFCVAGVEQPHIHLRFAWQAWHNLTSTIVSRGRRGTYDTGWRAWTGLVARDARDAAALCVAGVALGDFHLRFTWQAWHLVTSTFVSRGRPGTSGAVRLDWIGCRWRRGTLRGKRGTWRHWLSFHVVGVALGDIHLCFAWQAWCLVTSCDIHLRFAWQAWHLETCTFVLSHTIFYTPSLTHHLSHHFVTHHLSHTVTDHLSHTIFHTPLCLTPSFTAPSFTQHFVTHHLSHTIFRQTIFHTPSFTTPYFPVTPTLSHTIFHTPTLSHTIFHTPLCHTPPFIHHLSHITLSHTIFHTPSFTHHFVTYHLWHTALSHTTLSHTIFHTPSSTPLCHIPSFTHRHRPSFTHHLSHITLSHTIFHTPSFTHHFVTYHLWHTALSHTTLSHTIFHTQLCRTPSFTTPSLTHNFVTHHLSSNHLSHTTLSHTIFPTQLCHTLSFTHNFRTHHLSHTTLSHTLSFLVTHQLSHTTLSHTTLFYFSILHHLLYLSFLPRPRYNIWCLLLKEVVLWGYPVL